MSSNNQLVILKNKKGEFEVHYNLCVDNEFIPTKQSLLIKEDNLISAIRFANDYCRKEMIEYGYYIDNSCLEL